MSWYYKDGEQEIGPVTKAQLQELIHAKRINGKTLVRNASMDDWHPLAEMARPKAQANAGADPAPPPPGMPPVPPPVSPEPAFPTPAAPPELPVGASPGESAVCSQCGRSFPQDQVVRFDNQVICAACKPIFVQRLREGITMPGVLKYAGFWIRFGAKIIDGLIMVAAQYAILIPLGILAYSTFSSMPEGPKGMLSSGSLMLLGVQQLIGILIPAVYNTFFVGRFGATPGKMACRLKVVTPEGEKVTYARALGRNFAEWLSAIVMGIGYLMAAFDSEKRALHDRICSTRVVYK